jgi:hypothetical protein
VEAVGLRDVVAIDDLRAVAEVVDGHPGERRGPAEFAVSASCARFAVVEHVLAVIEERRQIVV